MSKEELYNIVFDTPELKEYVENKDKEIERLENIIKDVREWLNKTIFYFDFEKEVTSHTFELLYTAQGQDLSRILDQE